MNESRIQAIITKIERYRTELNHMDEEVRLYIEDKSRYGYPQFEQLIEEIYRFEREIYSFNNAEVQFRLDGLLESLLIHKRIWERRFDEDENKVKQYVADQDRFVNRAYNASAEIWTTRGVDPAESKKAFTERILPEYNAARESLKDGEKIVLSYDKNEQKIRVKVKVG